jgi:hypothetical protein
MKLIEYTGLMTLIMMLSMHIQPELKIGFAIQIISTIFLISPIIEYFYKKKLNSSKTVEVNKE